MSQAGLQAEFAFTPEFNFSGTEETFLAMGADYGLALFDVLAVENADFDGSGFVDGNDFLAWQRGLGTAIFSPGREVWVPAPAWRTGMPTTMARWTPPTWRSGVASSAARP